MNKLNVFDWRGARQYAINVFNVDGVQMLNILFDDSMIM